MDDLIRREDLLTSQYVHTECYLQENKDRHLDVYKKGWNDALQATYDNAPAVDAVEIVRCKDCKWWERYEDFNSGYCHAAKHWHVSSNWEITIIRTYKEDFFCAYGERKADG